MRAAFRTSVRNQGPKSRPATKVFARAPSEDLRRGTRLRSLVPDARPERGSHGGALAEYAPAPRGALRRDEALRRRRTRWLRAGRGRRGRGAPRPAPAEAPRPARPPLLRGLLLRGGGGPPRLPQADGADADPE